MIEKVDYHIDADTPFLNAIQDGSSVDTIAQACALSLGLVAAKLQVSV